MGLGFLCNESYLVSVDTCRFFVSGYLIKRNCDTQEGSTSSVIRVTHSLRVAFVFSFTREKMVSFKKILIQKEIKPSLRLAISKITSVGGRGNSTFVSHIWELIKCQNFR